VCLINLFISERKYDITTQVLLGVAPKVRKNLIFLIKKVSKSKKKYGKLFYNMAIRRELT